MADNNMRRDSFFSQFANPVNYGTKKDGKMVKRAADELETYCNEDELNAMVEQLNLLAKKAQDSASVEAGVTGVTKEEIATQNAMVTPSVAEKERQVDPKSVSVPAPEGPEAPAEAVTGANVGVGVDADAAKQVVTPEGGNTGMYEDAAKQQAGVPIPPDALVPDEAYGLEGAADGAEEETEEVEEEDEEMEEEGQDVTAFEILYDILEKGAAEEEATEAMEKEAAEIAENNGFEIAGEILDVLGFTVSDYANAVLGDEKLASDLIENAEMLSAEEDLPLWKVAVNLIDSVMEKAAALQDDED